MTETPAKKGPVVVSVLNLKGGVGKTTIAALLARYASGTGGFHMKGQKNLDVLTVDLDPQANLSQALMGEAPYRKFMDSGEPSIVELFKAPNRITAADVVNTTANNPDIVPSRFDFSDNLIESLRADEGVLDTFIRREMMHKDLILIDCAPTESILTRAAYRASHYVLIPVRTEFFATIGFPLMRKSLESFRASEYGHDIKVCVLINQSHTSGLSAGPHHRNALYEIRSLAAKYEWTVLYNKMWYSRGFPKWAKERNAPHLKNAVDEWPPVAEEILQLTGLVDEMSASDHLESIDHNFGKEIDKDMRAAYWALGALMKEGKGADRSFSGARDKMHDGSVAALIYDFPKSVKKITEEPGTQWEKCTRVGALIGELVSAIEREKKR